MFQLPEAFHVRRFQPAVFHLLLVVRGGTDPIVPPNLVDRAACVGVLQNGHNLCFGELRLAHENLLARVTIVPESSPYHCLNLGEAYSCAMSEHEPHLSNHL